MKTNFKKHALKYVIAENGNEDNFSDLKALIENALPDHIILKGKGIIIVKVEDETTNSILDHCKRGSEIKDSDLTVSELPLDDMGKTYEFWENIEKWSLIGKAATALAEAAKVNGMSIDDILILVTNMAKRKLNEM